MSSRRKNACVLNDGEIAGAVATLAAVLTRYNQHRHQRDEADRDKPFKILTFKDLIEGALQPAWQELLDEVRDDPVRTILRAYARQVGWKLYAAGGLDLMEKVLDGCDEALPREPAGAILDKWWDGLGLSKGGGVWCA